MGFRNWLLKPLIHQRNDIMASIADIKAKTDALIASAKANTDATAALTIYVDGLKTQIADIQAQLAAALANAGGLSADDQAALQSASDNLDALATSIDADTVAEAALSGTAQEPAPAPAEPTST